MSDSTDHTPQLVAGAHWPSHLRLWLVAAAAAAADLLTKQWVFNAVGWPKGLVGTDRIGGSHTVVDGFFDLETVYNPNAAMGLDASVFAMLAGLVFLVTAYGALREKGSRRVLYAVSAVVAAGFAVAALIIATTLEGAAATQGQRWLFVGVMIVIGLVFVGMFCRSQPRQWGTHIAIGLILGGDIGNLYDRIGHEYVRDFLRFTLPVIGPYPSFNLADAFLIVGVGLLALTLIRGMVHEAHEKKAEPTAKPSSQPKRKRRRP